MKKEDKNLISALMSIEASGLWSRKGLRKTDPLFQITFDSNELKKPIYKNVGVNSPSTLSKSIQNIFKNAMKEMISEIKKETGATIEYTDHPSFNRQNILVVHNDALPQQTLGGTRSLRTQDGTPDTPALLKNLAINVEEVESLQLNNTLRSTFLHEMGHAFGLVHPVPQSRDDRQFGTPLEPFETPPTLKDTVMASKNVVAACLDQHQDRAIQQTVCNELFPTKYQEADKIAIKEQVKRSLDSKYKSPFFNPKERHIEKSNIGIQSQEVLINGFKAFLSALFRTCIQFYIKPNLIQHCYIKNYLADLFGYSLEIVLGVPFLSPGDGFNN
jgi:predicted Zn-dependent protease with MMP-like domain